jgi:hypothetical protein
MVTGYRQSPTSVDALDQHRHPAAQKREPKPAHAQRAAAGDEATAAHGGYLPNQGCWRLWPHFLSNNFRASNA